MSQQLGRVRTALLLGLIATLIPPPVLPGTESWAPYVWTAMHDNLAFLGGKPARDPIVECPFMGTLAESFIFKANAH